MRHPVRSRCDPRYGVGHEADGNPLWARPRGLWQRGPESEHRTDHTDVEPNGERRIQMHGVISRGVEKVALSLCGAEARSFAAAGPPDVFHPVEPGRYTLKTTGEVVDNPDFTTAWTVHPSG